MIARHALSLPRQAVEAGLLLVPAQPLGGVVDARFDVLLYDLTSTYFESDPRFDDKRRFGYSRDKRPDCVQVVIALIVTPDGLDADRRANSLI